MPNVKNALSPQKIVPNVLSEDKEPWQLLFVVVTLDITKDLILSTVLNVLPNVKNANTTLLKELLFVLNVN